MLTPGLISGCKGRGTVSKGHALVSGQGGKDCHHISRGEIQAVLGRHKGTAELTELGD